MSAWTLATEVRRSPLRWWLPFLVAMDLLFLLGQGRSWIGVWPLASARASASSLFLAPLVAAGAAWVASRSSDPGVRSRLVGSARPRWLLEATQLGASCLVGLTAYLTGVVVAAVLTFRTAGPGTVWWSYVALGALLVVDAASLGHGIGAVTGARIGGAITAGVTTLVLVMTLANSVNLVVATVSVGQEANGTGLVVRAALSIGLAAAAMTASTVIDRSPPPVWTSRWAGVSLTLGLLLATGSGIALASGRAVALVPRHPPDATTCVGSSRSLCVWPDERKYLPELTTMSDRLSSLSGSGLNIPQHMVEEGLAVPPSTASFSLHGSVWMAAFEMSMDIQIRTWGTQWCLPTSEAAVNRIVIANEEMQYWLTVYLAGPQPANVFGGPPDIDAVAITKFATDGTAADHRAFVAEHIAIIDQARCAD